MFRPARAALLALLALPACGKIDHEDLPGEQVDALCDFYVRCGLAASAELCADLFSDILRGDPNLDAAVENGSVEYDPDAAKECIDAVHDLECGSAFLEDAPSDACDKVYQGTVADGGACWIDEQCKSGYCQAADCMAECCQGTCVAEPPPAGIGQDCSNSGCVDGAYCDFATDTCQPLKQAGGVCFSDQECAQGLECLGDTCQAGPAEGAPCIDTECALPLYCEPASMTCKKLPREGEACDLDVGACALGLVCNANSKTCTPPGGVGSPCSFDFFGGGCASGAWCDIDVMTFEGTCQATKANGNACSTDSECQSLYCSQDGTCVAEPVCVP